MDFSCTFVLPPQTPTRRGSRWRFHATAYLGGIDVARFRERIAMGRLFLSADLHMASTDEPPVARGRVSVGPAGSEYDLMIVIDMDLTGLPPAGERMLVLDWAADRGRNPQASPSRACAIVTIDPGPGNAGGCP